MDAYYYSFEPTGTQEVDRILDAVASAGSAFHHTQDWNESGGYAAGQEGETPVEWIQSAAVAAATEVRRLRSTLAQIRDEAAQPFGSLAVIHHLAGTRFRAPDTPTEARRDRA